MSHLVYLARLLWGYDWHRYGSSKDRLDLWDGILLNVFTSTRVGEYIESTAREGSNRGLRYKVRLLLGRRSIILTYAKTTRTCGSSACATNKATPSLLWKLRKMGKVRPLPPGESTPLVLVYRRILTALLQSGAFVTRGIRPPSPPVQPYALESPFSRRRTHSGTFRPSTSFSTLGRLRKALFASIGTRISSRDRFTSEATATSGLLAHTVHIFTMRLFELVFRPK